MDKRTSIILGVVVAVVFGASVASTLSYTEDRSQLPGGAAPQSPPSGDSTNGDGTSIVVPDFVSKETSIAQGALEDLGLEVTVEETGSPAGLWGEVLELEPGPGSSVLPGSEVVITSTTPDQRPLDLPDVTRDKKCPADVPKHHRNLRVVVGEGRILLGSATKSGVVQLRGTRSEGDTFRVSSLWTNGRRYKGEALIRGDRIDGPGRIAFEQDPDPTPAGPEPHGAPDELHFVEGGPPGGFAWSAVINYIGGPGCYAFQIEGEDFVEHIVVEARL